MSDTFDLRDALESWPYDPEDNIRVVKLADGREVLQVRLPMGVEQYEMQGRPDGERPYDMESALDFHLAQLEVAKQEDAEDEFELTEEECQELFGEGMLYYYRYLYLFQIEDWENTIRDTGRNLKLFDFIHEYAEREEDRQYLEQWRPYIVRIHAVARAMLALSANDHSSAVAIVKKALRTIEELPMLDDNTYQFERERSVTTLQDLAKQLEKALPMSDVERLERDLVKAVEAEEFERAAEIRDKIRQLRSNPAQP